MKIIVLLSTICVLLISPTANAQIQQEDGTWIGSDLLKGNPHGLAMPVLLREPAECGELIPPNQERGVYEPASWINNTIPFQFDANVSNDQKIAMISAMDNVAENCKIKFVWRSDETDYIHILDSDRNSSFVGRIGGQQEINIFNWNFEFIMVHELYHAIGIWHEQSAPNRDSFVNILTQNIQPDALHNFDLRPDANNTAYDYDSVMHYRRNAFTSNGQDTIMTIDPQFQSVIGQRDHISVLDISTIRIMHEDPVPTEWLMHLVFYPEPNGDFDNNWNSPLDAINFAPSGSRVVNTAELDFDMFGTLIINKNMVIEGKKLILR